MAEGEDRRTPLWRRPVVVGPIVAVAVVAAAVASTTFVPAGSVAQAADTAVDYADENYESVVVPAVADSAQPLDELVAALVADPDAAGEEFGSREDEGKPWSFATEAAGTVVEGGFGEIGLEVAGMPEGITVGVAIPPFGSNTALRDAGTDLTFGDFVNQTEFQNVAIELNTRAVESVYGDLDPGTLLGSTIDVVGAFSWVSKTGGDIDHVTIVPVQIEVGS
jgi:predicted lipoprotein